MGDEWKSTVKSVAPSIGSLLDGPLGKMALKVIADALLGPNAPKDNPEEAIQAVLSRATPDLLLKLKQAENDFKLAMHGAQLAVAPVLGVATKEGVQPESPPPSTVQPKDRTTRNLAYAYTAGYFALLLIVIFRGVNEGAANLINTLIGVLTASQVGIMTYYFGSSAGSARKTDLLTQQTKG